jgi:hypothetical protein
VGSRKAAERVFRSITAWIEKHLKVPVNYDKSDSGRPWERQFLGFQPTEDGALRPAPKSLKKLKDRVHGFFSGRRSGTSEQLRDEWLRYIRGWCQYFAPANEPRWRESVSGWIRRHIGKCFWLRWHSKKGRIRNLLKLGVEPWQIKRCHIYSAAWPMSKHFVMQIALNNQTLKRYGFFTPSDFAAT